MTLAERAMGRERELIGQPRAVRALSLSQLTSMRSPSSPLTIVIIVTGKVNHPLCRGRSTSLFLDPVPQSSSSIQFLNPCLPASKSLVTSCSLCSLLGSVCMNTLRLFSLKMAAAIPGSNPSFLVNHVCHASVSPDQSLQIRAV